MCARFCDYCILAFKLEASRRSNVGCVSRNSSTDCGDFGAWSHFAYAKLLQCERSGVFHFESHNHAIVNETKYKSQHWKSKTLPIYSYLMLSLKLNLLSLIFSSTLFIFVFVFSSLYFCPFRSNILIFNFVPFSRFLFLLAKVYVCYVHKSLMHKIHSHWIFGFSFR